MVIYQDDDDNDDNDVDDEWWWWRKLFELIAQGSIGHKNCKKMYPLRRAGFEPAT